MNTPLTSLVAGLAETSWDETGLDRVLRYVRASRALVIPEEWRGCLDSML